MFSTSTLKQVKEILRKISTMQEVSLEERLFVQKLANKDQRINSWLKQARRLNQSQESSDGIDDLLNGLNLGDVEPNSFFKPGQDDLGEWFSGAPAWIVRS